jgi:DNA-directed RNA polymerase specialized sigma24 family protein
MPEPLALVAVYYYVDELSHAEIARIMGCSSRHVGNLLERLTLWAANEESAACST